MPAPHKNQAALLFCWALTAVIVLALDYVTGPFIRFPIMYLIPIVFASWNNGLRWGLVFAGIMPLVHLAFSISWPTLFTWFYAVVNTAILITVFIGFAYLVSKVSLQKKALEQEIKVLEGILPICSFCKKIRNPEGDWEALEPYIATRSQAEFSHGLCPDCAKKHYPEFYQE